MSPKGTFTSRTRKIPIDPLGKPEKNLEAVRQSFDGLSQTINGLAKEVDKIRDLDQNSKSAVNRIVDLEAIHKAQGDLDVRYYRRNGFSTMDRLRLNVDTKELTISGGVIKKTGILHTVDTEADAATDDLDTINGGNKGDIILLRGESAVRIPKLKHNVGNIRMPSQQDLVISGVNDYKILMFDGTDWIVLNDSFASETFRVGFSGNGAFRILYFSSNGITTIANDNTVDGSMAFVCNGNEILRLDSPNQRVGINNNTPTYDLDVNGKVRAQDQFILPSYTVAGVPTGVTGGMIFVTDETGGAVAATFDGTNWRRVTDRAIVA